MQKKIAIVLSGCGFKDGAEITESVSTLITVSELGLQYRCFAPLVDFEAAPHSEHSGPLGRRNCLEEAARIARGEIEDIRSLQEKDFDAVVFPGGFGAALHLCNWATKGAACEVHPELKRVITSFHSAHKPIGAICIAPALIARVLGHTGLSLTIGDDADTAAEIAKTGAHHVKCKVTDFISDRDHKVLSTPAYMYHAKPFEVFGGIRKMIKELSEMA